MHTEANPAIVFIIFVTQHASKRTVKYLLNAWHLIVSVKQIRRNTWQFPSQWHLLIATSLLSYKYSIYTPPQGQNRWIFLLTTHTQITNITFLNTNYICSTSPLLQKAMSYCLPTILMSTVLSLSLPMDNCTPTGQINKHCVCTCIQKRKKKLVKVVMMQCCQQVANRPCITTNIITHASQTGHGPWFWFTSILKDKVRTGLQQMLYHPP